MGKKQKRGQKKWPRKFPRLTAKEFLGVTELKDQHWKFSFRLYPETNTQIILSSKNMNYYIILLWKNQIIIYMEEHTAGRGHKQAYAIAPADFRTVETFAIPSDKIKTIPIMSFENGQMISHNQGRHTPLDQ